MIIWYDVRKIQFSKAVHETAKKCVSKKAFFQLKWFLSLLAPSSNSLTTLPRQYVKRYSRSAS